MFQIWFILLLKKFWKLLISLLFSAFTFYIIIYHSIHSLKGNTSQNITIFKHFEYYIAQVTLNLEFILPQLIAITTIIILSSMQNKREVVFLKSSGLSLKKFSSPLILSSLLLVGFLYVNFQWIYPHCEEIVNNYTKKSSTSLINKEAIPTFYLKNQTLLLCSNLNIDNKIMFSAIWIKNPKEIYKIEELSFSENTPLGKGVAQFLKNQDNQFILNNYSPSLTFQKQELEFEIYDNPFSNIFLNKNRNKLFSLYKSIPWKDINYGLSTTNFLRLANLVSQFFYKLFSPLACIIAVVVPIRYCLKFNRMQMFSLSYLISLGVVNLFFICLKSAVILTNSNILPALSALAVPTFIIFLFTCCQYYHVN